jgi:hypothetical protein
MPRPHFTRREKMISGARQGCKKNMRFAARAEKHNDRKCGRDLRTGQSGAGTVIDDRRPVDLAVTMTRVRSLRIAVIRVYKSAGLFRFRQAATGSACKPNFNEIGRYFRRPITAR